MELNGNHQELISEEVQEIINLRPHWIIRLGNTILLAVLSIIILVTCFISYPDTIRASAILTSLNPHKLIVAKTEGKLVRLLVRNNDIVKEGQHLAYLESSANYDQVLKLADWLAKASSATTNDSIGNVIKFNFPVLTQLGELQLPYQLFQNEWVMTKQTINNGYFQKKKEALLKDLKYIFRLNNVVHNQKVIQLKDREIQESELLVYEKLASEKVIAPMEVNQYRSKLLGKEQQIEQIEALVTSNEISSHNVQKELLEIDKYVEDQQQRFRSSLLQLKSEVESWMQRYILRAPEAGRVLFVSSLTENQFILSSQTLFYLQPYNTDYYVEMLSGQKGIGKVKEGQDVLLRVEGYPSEEFGYLKGKILSISDLPNRSDSFLLKAELTNGLITDYGKNLYFRNNLSAQAEIITDSRRLIDRLLGKLKGIFNRNPT